MLHDVVTIIINQSITKTTTKTNKPEDRKFCFPPLSPCLPSFFSFYYSFPIRFLSFLLLVSPFLLLFLLSFLPLFYFPDFFLLFLSLSHSFCFCFFFLALKFLSCFTSLPWGLTFLPPPCHNEKSWGEHYVHIVAPT